MSNCGPTEYCIPSERAKKEGPFWETSKKKTGRIEDQREQEQVGVLHGVGQYPQEASIIDVREDIYETAKHLNDQIPFTAGMLEEDCSPKSTRKSKNIDLM